MSSYCIFSAHYLPHIGGIEKYTDNLARELGSQGCQVTVVTNALNNDAGIEKLSSNVDIVRLPCFPAIGGRLPIPKHNKLFKELWKKISGRRFDGVLINARFYPHTFLGLRLSSCQGVRPFVVDHGSAYLTFGSAILDPIVACYERVVTHFVKRYDPIFFAVSNKGVQWLKNFEIQGEGVLSNSIDAVSYRSSASARDYRFEFGIDEATMIVAYTGRLIPEKGIVRLMEAARILKSRNVPVVFALAGDGPLREKAESLNPGNVFFLGRTTPSDVAALMLQADLLCMLTRSEGFSTTLLEASACGTPALITDVGGVDELIPDESYGTVLAGDTAEEAALQIERLERNRGLLKSQGEKVADRVERMFSWRNTANAFIEACGEFNSELVDDSANESVR